MGKNIGIGNNVTGMSKVLNISHSLTDRMFEH